MGIKSRDLADPAPVKPEIMGQLGTDNLLAAIHEIRRMESFHLIAVDRGPRQNSS